MTKLLYKLAALIAAGIGSGVFYARAIEPRRLNYVELPVFVFTLDPLFDGYRIVQFSDLHIDGGTMSRARLETIVTAINALEPDLIAFTGDFVTYMRGFRLVDMIEPFRRLRARDGVVAVTGNHDHKINEHLIERVIGESGMINLDNRVHTVRRNSARLHIAGVGSVLRQKARLDLVLDQLDDDSPAILLAHEPDFADVSAATGRFALQLSGHSHGGQIRLPFLTRFALPHYSTRYVEGIDQVKEMMLYTNRGVGTVGLPLRFNCPPEITVLTLRSAWRMGGKQPLA